MSQMSFIVPLSFGLATGIFCFGQLSGWLGRSLKAFKSQRIWDGTREKDSNWRSVLFAALVHPSPWLLLICVAAIVAASRYVTPGAFGYYLVGIGLAFLYMVALLAWAFHRMRARGRRAAQKASPGQPGS
jgi:hypothetical protein